MGESVGGEGVGGEGVGEVDSSARCVSRCGLPRERSGERHLVRGRGRPASGPHASCSSTYSVGVWPVSSRNVFVKEEGERKPTA